MLRDEFPKIESWINYFLAEFLTEVNREVRIGQNFSERDTSGLLSIFINEYETIRSFMNWPETEKDLIDSAYGVRRLRNKYYHTHLNQVISDIDEKIGLLHVIRLMESFEALLNENEDYGDFISYLNELWNGMLSKVSYEKDQPENDSAKIMDDLSDLRDTVSDLKNIVLKQNQNIEDMKNEIVSKLKKGDVLEKPKNKKIVTAKKKTGNNHLEVFSSENIDPPEENGRVDQENTEEIKSADQNPLEDKSLATDTVEPITEEGKLRAWFFSVDCDFADIAHRATLEGIRDKFTGNDRKMLFQMEVFYRRTGKLPSLRQLRYVKDLYERYVSLTSEV